MGHSASEGALGWSIDHPSGVDAGESIDGVWTEYPTSGGVATCEHIKGGRNDHCAGWKAGDCFKDGAEFARCVATVVDAFEVVKSVSVNYPVGGYMGCVDEGAFLLSLIPSRSSRA